MSKLMLLALLGLVGFYCLAAARSVVDEDDDDPETEDYGVENELSDMPEDEKRYRRGFRGYYYNYLDEMAMSICASVPTHTSGTIFAVRRTCGEKATCKSICENPSLRKNAGWVANNARWSCIESLHVYKHRPRLADNYDAYTDSHKLGLKIYRHHSCAASGCGPNYCCCRAGH